MVSTSRTAFSKLQSTLGPHFPAGCGLSLDDFMDVESVLSLAVHVSGEGAIAAQAVHLLMDYPLIAPEFFGPKEHLMQLARRHLIDIASAMAWRRLLDAYLADAFSPIRAFDVVDDAITVRANPFGGAGRADVYIERLLEPFEPHRSCKFAKPGGKYSYPVASKGQVAPQSYERIRHVRIPSNVPAAERSPDDSSRKQVRNPISVDLSEFERAAEELSAATGRDHYAQQVEKICALGLLRHPQGAGAEPAGALVLDRVTNLVGLVGSGKSVIADVLTFYLAKRGYRVAVLLNSTSEVLDKVSLFKSSGISSSPLISQRERINRLNEIADRSSVMLLDEMVSRYVETPCIIDGLSCSEENACDYSDTPCHKLRSTGKRRYTCPYWDVCPSQAMAREALTSSVVVTTPAGFAHMTVGVQRKPFFEVVLERFDVVLFDEADRVQVQLDSAFSPVLSFQELVRAAADPTAEAMKRPADEKMRDLNEENYLDQLLYCEPTAKALLKAVRGEEVSSWQIVHDEAFTSVSLLADLRDQGLPEMLADDVERLISSYFYESERRDEAQGQDPLDLLMSAIATSCMGVDDALHMRNLDAYLAARGLSSLDSLLRMRLSFLLKVMRFDAYLRELARASDLALSKNEKVDELRSFLQFTFRRQQRYLPSALIGNLFGFRLDGNDLKLFRQVAFGRAMMTSLPWLDTDPEGSPLGPHALLLSGSSWEPGCLQFHVNKPVDYLLFTEQWKIDKLSSTVVRDLGLEQRVSGSGVSKRQSNLSAVLSQLGEVISEELARPGSGKALVVVNSYAEAEQARRDLEAALRSAGCGEQVAFLAKSREAGQPESELVLRSQVHRFAAHPARVLVAPALAVERGFNIVDDDGNAAFTALVFAVRPMSRPREMDLRHRKLNGILEREAKKLPTDSGSFSYEIRKASWKWWKILERDEMCPLGALRNLGRHVFVDDIVATLLSIVVQLFGRMARFSDRDWCPPRIYFADGAFHGREQAGSFDTLTELYRYMKHLMEDEAEPSVARALYGPLYKALGKGLGYE